MGYDIGPRIGIEGEKEFRDAIKAINTNMKTLATEMEAVTSEYEKNDSSVEALTARNQVLNKQIEAQKEKLEQLRAGLEASKEKYGENDEVTQKWQQAVNKATADLNNMERQLKDNNTTITESTKKTDEFGSKQEETGEKTTGFGDTINGLAGKFGITLPDGVKESLNSMQGLDAGMLTMIGTAAAAAVAIYKVVDALAEMSIEQAYAADDLITLSTKTGLTTETLQELTYAAELLDTPVTTVTDSITKLTNNMDSARKGNKDTADAFAKLRVEYKDGNGELRDSEDVFWDVIDALGEMENETEKDALAMDLMGRKAKDLNPLIAAGKEGVEAYAQAAHDMGYVLTNEQLGALLALSDSMAEYNNQVTTGKNLIAVELSPALTNLIEVGKTTIAELSQALIESGILDVVASLLDIVASLAPAIQVILDLVMPSKDAILQIAFALAGLADTLKVIISSLATVIELIRTVTGLGGSWSQVGKYWDNVTEVMSGNGSARGVYDKILTNKMSEYGVGRNATGTSYYPGGPTWTGENGPELLWLPESTAIFDADRSKRIVSAIMGMTQSAQAPMLVQNSTSSTTSSGDVYNGPVNVYPTEKQWNQLMRMMKQYQGARQSNRA